MTISSRNLNLTALVCCAVMLSAATAHATASLTYTASFGPNLTDWSGPNTPIDQGGPARLSIPQFNTAQGTLESVLITSNASASSNGQYVNNGVAAALVSGYSNIELDLMPANSTGDANAYDANFTGANPLVSAYPTFAAVSNISLAANGGTYTYASGAGTPDTQSTTITGTANLAAYEGAGYLVFPLYTMTISNLTGTNASSVTINQTTYATENLTVTYNYGVPEPASIAILGSALAGWALVRRRKR